MNLPRKLHLRIPSVWATGFIFALAVVQPAQAQLVVDDLSTAQSLIQDPPAGLTGSSVVAGAGILLSERDLRVQRASASGTVSAQVTAGVLTFSVPAGADGTVEMVWDGADGNALVLDPTGLGGVNLAGNSLRLRAGASTSAASAVFEIHTDAANSSRAALAIPLGMGVDLYLAPSDFIVASGAGADFSNVGAIVLKVSGADTTVDVDLVDAIAPQLVATMTDALLVDADNDLKADPGDTIRYTITLSNTGGKAIAVNLADTIDANTTLVGGSVRTTPIAQNDHYEVTAGSALAVDGTPSPTLLANDIDPDGDTVTIVAFDAMTARGGQVTAVNATGGGFTYQPPAGFIGVDTFGYTIEDNDGNAVSAVATFNVSGVSAIDLFPGDVAIASPTAQHLADPASKDFLSKKALLQSILSAATLAECAVDLPIDVIIADVNCYGPSMLYAGHPDMVRRSGTSAKRAWDGTLPTGDLAIWRSTEGSEACLASKLNSRIDAAAIRVESSLILGAVSACVMKHSGIALPAIGAAPLDLTSEVASLLNSGQSDPFTITSINVERLANAGSDVVLHYHFGMSAATDSQVYASDLYHQQDLANPSLYSGKIANTLEYDNGSGTKAYGYSLEYSRSGSDLEARMLSAQYDGTVAAASIFDANHVLNVAGTWVGDFAQSIYHVDITSGDSEMSYGWQAGTGDSHARVFNAYARTGPDTVVRGCGWHGYGPRFVNSGTPALSDNTIERFICNWAGPGNLHNDMSQLDRAQKQCVYLDSADGLFKIDQDGAMSDISFITYAPTNSCNVGDPFDFDYTIPALFETVIDAQITNNLRTLSTDSNYIEWQSTLVPIWTP